MTTDVVSTDHLQQAWQGRPGLSGWLGAVNHKAVGKRFIVTALGFFLVGGIQALVMRWHLGTPESTFLDPDTYNALFTMHGTTMMFLFAVPITEAFGIYFVPLMIGTRDMPLPRLSAFGYWTYVAGGLFLYSSFLTGAVPDGGWFAYTPLTGPEFSPGNELDFWLLGVTFVEISGVVAAIELIVLILRCRAPGMAISRMPLFVWTMLVTSVMIVFAFPPLIIGSILLELDRKIGTVFYDAAAGGDPVLWQHIFWWFGHPEVYIMLLPALGIVSSIVPVFARTRIVGYTLIVTATVAIGIVSFGLWVHHMFTIGLPYLALTFFTAGSLLIAIPSGVQIFAWIATLWQGRIMWRTPLLFTVGFVVLFVMGGMTGVMVAAAPFDDQVHDTYFVVAHFHYVLIGGVVFPVFAAFYYWMPKITGRMLSERLGRISFWLTFVGFNLTFFPLHILGLIGMPRRIATWPSQLGWEPYNLLSTVGAFVLAAGFLVSVAAFLRALRTGTAAGGDPWGANTLEWATASPPAPYNFREFPLVASRDPLWDPPVDPERFDAASWRPGLAAPERATRQIVTTSVLDGEPEEIVTLPVYSWWPLVLTGTLVVLLTGVMVSARAIALVGIIGTVIAIWGWLWSREDGPA